MNRLSLANVIAFIIGVAVLVGFLDREGRLSYFLRGTNYEEVSTESPRPRAFKLAPEEEETTSASTALSASPQVESSPVPSPRPRFLFPIPPDILKLPQFDNMSFWIQDEWEVPDSEYLLSIHRSAKVLMTEVSLRTKLYKLKPGEGVLFLARLESDFDKVLRTGMVGNLYFEAGINFQNIEDRKPINQTHCRLETSENKLGNELHYEQIERGILVGSTKILKDKKGYSGVEIRGVVRTTKLLGQIVSISCYIKDAGGAQRYQELELIHLFYNLGSKGRLVPIKKK